MSWSTIDLAFQCLADVPRTRAFLDALAQVVTPRSVVLDAGSGTGALAIAAAKLGASEVIAVEQDPFAARILASNVRSHSLPVKVLCGDVRDLSLPACDVVVAELVDIWLLEEQLADVVVALRDRGVIQPHTRIIPSAYDFDIELGYCDWQFPFFVMRSPFYEWPYLHDKSNGWLIPQFTPVTAVIRAGTVELDALRSAGDQTLDFSIDLTTIKHEDMKSIDAARLRGTVRLTDSLDIEFSGSMNAPIVLPIESGLVQRPGNEINIRGMMSGGFESLSMSLGGRELLPWRA